jgi:hypothetical protein
VSSVVACHLLNDKSPSDATATLTLLIVKEEVPATVMHKLSFVASSLSETITGIALHTVASN